MKIVIFGARGVPAKWGGFDTFVTELTPRLVKMGHQVTLYTMPKYTDESIDRDFHGVRIVRRPTAYGKFTETVFHEFLSSLHALFSPRYDLYYVLACRTVWAYLPLVLLRRTVVINTDGLDWQRRKWGKLSKLYLKFNYWLARKVTPYLVSDAKALQDFYIEQYCKRSAFLTNGGHLLYNEGDTQDKILEEYDLTSRHYYLVACRIEPENNTDIIISEYLASGATDPLVICGGTNYKSPHLAELQETDDPRVRFLGPIYTPGHIEALHLNAKAYLHGHEVGGTNPSLLKAMGCGNVTLAHDVSFNREVLGGTGWLWTKDEGSLKARIEEVEQNQEAMQAQADAACRERIQTFYSWDKVADDHELFFRWVLGQAANYNDSF